MRERPILFSAPMVRALLAGTKTQTRRIVKPQPPSVEDVRKRAGIEFHPFNDGRCHDRNGEPLWRVAGPVWAVRELMGMDPISDPSWRCPYGRVGDHLWVREAFALAPLCADPIDEDDWSPVYRADDDGRPWLSSLDENAVEVKAPWKPSIYMPRWASRITLEVTGVRVERVQDITEGDAKAEGVEPAEYTRKCYPSKLAADIVERSYRDGFANLWRQINGAASWDANPWVWVVEFCAVARAVAEEGR